MLKNYCSDKYHLQPLDATSYGDSSFNDKFQTLVTK